MGKNSSSKGTQRTYSFRSITLCDRCDTRHAANAACPKPPSLSSASGADSDCEPQRQINRSLSMSDHGDAAKEATKEAPKEALKE